MSESYDVIDGLGMPYIQVIRSDAVPPGRYYLMSSASELQPMIWQREPVTIKGQAAQIVQEGLSDVVAWLRAAGHDIPSWESIDEQEQWGMSLGHYAWRSEERMAFSVHNPDSPHAIGVVIP